MLGERFTTVKTQNKILLLKLFRIAQKIVKKIVLPGIFNSRVGGFCLKIIDKYKSNFVRTQQ